MRAIALALLAVLALAAAGCGESDTTKSAEIAASGVIDPIAYVDCNTEGSTSATSYAFASWCDPLQYGSDRTTCKGVRELQTCRVRTSEGAVFEVKLKGRSNCFVPVDAKVVSAPPRSPVARMMGDVEYPVGLVTWMTRNAPGYC
jgi:hypothetical protein